MNINTNADTNANTKQYQQSIQHQPNIPSAIPSTNTANPVDENDITIPLNDWSEGSVLYRSIGDSTVIAPQLSPMEHFFTLVYEVYERAHKDGWQPPFMYDTGTEEGTESGSKLSSYSAIERQKNKTANSTSLLFLQAKARKDAVNQHIRASVADLDEALQHSYQMYSLLQSFLLPTSKSGSNTTTTSTSTTTATATTTIASTNTNPSNTSVTNKKPKPLATLQVGASIRLEQELTMNLLKYYSSKLVSNTNDSHSHTHTHPSAGSGGLNIGDNNSNTSTNTPNTTNTILTPGPISQEIIDNANDVRLNLLRAVIMSKSKQLYEVTNLLKENEQYLRIKAKHSQRSLHDISQLSVFFPIQLPGVSALLSTPLLYFKSKKDETAAAHAGTNVSTSGSIPTMRDLYPALQNASIFESTTTKEGNRLNTKFKSLNTTTGRTDYGSNSGIRSDGKNHLEKSHVSISPYLANMISTHVLASLFATPPPPFLDPFWTGLSIISKPTFLAYISPLSASKSQVGMGSSGGGSGAGGGGGNIGAGSPADALQYSGGLLHTTIDSSALCSPILRDSSGGIITSHSYPILLPFIAAGKLGQQSHPPPWDNNRWSTIALTLHRDTLVQTTGMITEYLISECKVIIEKSQTRHITMLIESRYSRNVIAASRLTSKRNITFSNGSNILQGSALMNTSYEIGGINPIYGGPYQHAFIPNLHSQSPLLQSCGEFTIQERYSYISKGDDDDDDGDGDGDGGDAKDTIKKMKEKKEKKLKKEKKDRKKEKKEKNTHGNEDDDNDNNDDNDDDDDDREKRQGDNTEYIIVLPSPEKPIILPTSYSAVTRLADTVYVNPLLAERFRTSFQEIMTNDKNNYHEKRDIDKGENVEHGEHGGNDGNDENDEDNDDNTTGNTLEKILKKPIISPLMHYKLKQMKKKYLNAKVSSINLDTDTNMGTDEDRRMGIEVQSQPNDELTRLNIAQSSIPYYYNQTRKLRKLPCTENFENRDNHALYWATLRSQRHILLTRRAEQSSRSSISLLQNSIYGLQPTPTLNMSTSVYGNQHHNQYDQYDNHDNYIQSLAFTQRQISVRPISFLGCCITSVRFRRHLQILHRKLTQINTSPRLLLHYYLSNNILSISSLTISQLQLLKPSTFEQYRAYNALFIAASHIHIKTNWLGYGSGREQMIHVSMYSQNIPFLHIQLHGGIVTISMPSIQETKSLYGPMILKKIAKFHTTNDKDNDDNDDDNDNDDVDTLQLLQSLQLSRSFLVQDIDGEHTISIAPNAALNIRYDAQDIFTMYGGEPSMESALNSAILKAGPIAAQGNTRLFNLPLHTALQLIDIVVANKIMILAKKML